MRIKDLIISRGILAIILSIIFGISFYQHSVSEYEKGKSLTLEVYIENFETHKNDLMQYADNTSLFYALSISIVSITFLVFLYEIIAYGLYKLVEKR
jgi:uncharacterized protein YqhQ